MSKFSSNYFPTKRIYKGCWKNAGPTFLQHFSNHEDKVEDGRLCNKYVPYFQQELESCPLDWRITIY